MRTGYLPGPGDVRTGPEHCMGGACPHDHGPEPVWCERCDQQVDAADPDGTGPAICADCSTCWLCKAVDGVELSVDGDPECPSCRDVGGADEWEGAV